MTVLERDGVYFDLVGQGRSVVVFPGGPARHPDYLEHLAGLDAHGFQFATIFPVGIGASPEPDDVRDYAASRQADSIETVRAHLGQDQVTLIAHSGGAVVALNYAMKHPQRLHRLVLITPATRVVGLVDTEQEYEAQLLKQQHQPWYPDARQAMDEIDASGVTPERRAAMMPLLYGSWTPTERTRAARDPQQSSRDARDHYFDDAPDPASVRAAMALVTCPTRILIGEVDPGPGPQLAGSLAALFPDATVTSIEGAGHFPWVTHPERFRAQLIDALDR